MRPAKAHALQMRVDAERQARKTPMLGLQTSGAQLKYIEALVMRTTREQVAKFAAEYHAKQQAQAGAVWVDCPDRQWPGKPVCRVRMTNGVEMNTKYGGNVEFAFGHVVAYVLAPEQ